MAKRYVAAVQAAASAALSQCFLRARRRPTSETKTMLRSNKNNHRAPRRLQLGPMANREDEGALPPKAPICVLKDQDLLDSLSCRQVIVPVFPHPNIIEHPPLASEQRKSYVNATFRTRFMNRSSGVHMFSFAGLPSPET